MIKQLSYHGPCIKIPGPRTFGRSIRTMGRTGDPTSTVFSLAPLSYVSFVAQTRHETIVRYTISTLVVFLIVFVNFANRVRHRLVRVSQAHPILPPGWLPSSHILPTNIDPAISCAFEDYFPLSKCYFQGLYSHVLISWMVFQNISK